MVMWDMAWSQASGARAGKEETKGRLQFMLAMDKCHPENLLHRL